VNGKGGPRGPPYRLPQSRLTPSRQRRPVDNKSARWTRKIVREENPNKKLSRTARQAGWVFQSVKRQREYQGYRTATPEVAGSGGSLPILIGAAMIAAAILLSTLITALGGRYAGFESPTDETAWLVDRLTGSVYKCQARDSGKASCQAEVTGSLAERPKH
jgi:hypothetical protein